MSELLNLNLGCGKRLMRGPGWVNVDGWGEPDIKHDLNVMPWPFADDSVDHIAMYHVLEHLTDWWGGLKECCRIMKIGGTIDIRVPDESNSCALTYRDHLRVFDLRSFHMTESAQARGANNWADEQAILPIRLETYLQVPFPKYQWMVRWAPWLLKFVAVHMRNFIFEQRFFFRKVRRYENGR